jgi:dihydroorotate dehydrogenase (fumarate)
MPDLSVKYFGLDLKNPVIIGSCDLTNKLDNLIELEKNNAAAIVLKSIFEEEILKDISSLEENNFGTTYQAETYDYIKNYIENSDLDKYLQLISDAKEKLSIPVIASINCVSSDNWISYAQKFEKYGADALELNIYILPENIMQSSDKIENTYYEIVENVKKHTKIPIAVKLSPYFTSLPNLCYKLTEYGAAGLTLFNRFRSPDIDTNNLKLIPATSIVDKSDYSLSLRWIGLLSDKLKNDFVLSSGIRNGEDIAKAVLAGAKGVQIVSALYKHGIPHLKTIINDFEKWMSDNKHDSMSDIFKKMSQSQISGSSYYERFQFMK